MHSLASAPATFIRRSWINEGNCSSPNYYYLLLSACSVLCKRVWSQGPYLYTWVKVGRLWWCVYSLILLLLMSVDKLLVGFFPPCFLILLCFSGVLIVLARSQEPRDMGRAVWGGAIQSRSQKQLSSGGLNGAVLSAVVKAFCNTRLT